MIRTNDKILCDTIELNCLIHLYIISLEIITDSQKIQTIEINHRD